MVRLALIGTGGTFSNEGTGPLDYLTYLGHGVVLPVQEVLELMPDVSGLAEIVPVPFASLRSKEIGPGEWRSLARAIAEQGEDPQIDGVIVTHGTGVLEETAYALHLTLDLPVPVVVLGAQRPPTTAGSDAQKNYLDAIHWIRAQTRTHAGVVVVMDQQVHSARDVAKLANHTLSAMESPARGPIARVEVDGGVSVYRQPAGRHASEFAGILQRDHPLPRVDVVHQYAGADATAIDAYVDAGARGIIVVGFPPGTNTPEIDAAIARHCAAGTVIVQASRSIRDPRILSRSGLGPVIRNGDLSPQHARILLMFALARGYGRTEIQRVFDEY